MGCKIRITKAGNVAFRLYWRGIESQESTGSRATQKNLAVCQRTAARIDALVRHGLYTDDDYRRDFPLGARREIFGQAEWHKKKPTAVTDATVAEYFPAWLEASRVTKRPTRIHDYETQFRLYVEPYVGTLRIREIMLDDLRAWQKALIVDRGLAVNTAYNAICGTFRALFNDARRSWRKVIGDIGDPFDGLQWPQKRQELRVPIATEDEQIILEHFRRKNAHYYPFISFLLGTGCRPSEATGLTWQHVDLRTGRVQIAQARVRGHVMATKTSASSRTITLAPHLVELLRERQPLHVAPDAFVFMNHRGKPIEQSAFSTYLWQRALRVAGVRHYPLYSTRHTYISRAISAGANPKHVAEYVGTSLAKIDTHYGRWMGSTDADPLTIAERRNPDDSIIRVRPSQKR
jgi:integrase